MNILKSFMWITRWSRASSSCWARLFASLKIKVPIFVIATILDHIAPWKSTFKGLAKVRGERTFILSESGHIAGIVNPPSKDKYGHWHNPEPPRDPDFWLENAVFEKKSWWGRWDVWLTEDESQDAAARKPGANSHPVIEDAPGRYVTAVLN